ncbi:C-Maf-inducing protein-like [Planococcus citri]|uniref:C-Maf-inducing protein-like n=1 Tax=Planococcus citri TaxID=170843 RepID=UPI0031F76EA5
MINEETIPEDITDVENKNVVNEDTSSNGVVIDPVSWSTEELHISAEDTSSQSSSSKENSVNEITLLVENLTAESDHFEKISTETVDIELLPQTIDNECNLCYEKQSPDENSNISNNQIIDDTVNLPANETNKWGENKRRQSLMMKNALKNSLDASAIEILKGNMKDLIKNSTNDYKNCLTSESPDNDMYAWASSCANLNPTGPRFKLLKEGDIQVCYLDHTRTVLSKILSFKFLRHFELHRLYLNESRISPKNPTRMMESAIDYNDIHEVYVFSRWDTGQKYFLRIIVSEGSYLLQANNSYTRNQWYFSILWKKHMFKYRNILRGSSNIEIILKELKNFVEFVKTTPIQDHEVYNTPIEIISKLLRELFEQDLEQNWRESLIVHISPLLERYRPSSEMCQLFSDHCRMYPRSFSVQEAFNTSVHHILIHNVDFAKYPFLRKLLQDYIKALSYHNDADEALKLFVARSHGSNYECPHPRVMPNLASSCLAAIVCCFEECNIPDDNLKNIKNCLHEEEFEDPIDTYKCFLTVLQYMSEYNDWLPGLANMLQPIPIHGRSLNCEYFVRNMGSILEKIAKDSRCNTHSQVIGPRVEKDGWFDIYCPVNTICNDDGRLWSLMVDKLLNCCNKRKSFLLKLYEKQLEACLLLALRGNSACQMALCLMLEWNLVKECDQQVQITATLQSTESGLIQYNMLCKRQQHLKKIQQKGGPAKLTLPCRSTDNDLFQLFSNGSFGNLERLTLAFTHTTSACAETLIKLPSLKYLNLWATQFGDEGLIVISEHLTNLQALNLCETPITDKGISSLTTLTNLKWLNLNSTKLSSSMLEILRKKLPHLNELDVRYTEAW